MKMLLYIFSSILGVALLAFGTVQGGKIASEFGAKTPKLVELTPNSLAPTNFESLSKQKEAHEKFKRVIVPLFRVGKILTVEVKLNGSTDVRMIVDTGASITILAPRVGKQLSFSSPENSYGEYLVTASGTEKIEVRKLQSIQVGSAKKYDVPVAIHDLPELPIEVDGLLGMSFFEDFLLIIDVHKNQLSLASKG